MNLLPKQHKEDLRNGFKLRFFITTMFVVSASFLIGFIMLLPSYFLTPGRFIEMEPENFYADEDSAPANEILGLPEEIDSKLKFLQTHLSSASATHILSEVVLSLPDGVGLDSITLVRDASYKGKNGVAVSISGNAPDRESLLAFSSSLRESDFFSEVDVPVSNLARDRNLPFSIEMLIEN